MPRTSAHGLMGSHPDGVQGMKDSSNGRLQTTTVRINSYWLLALPLLLLIALLYVYPIVKVLCISFTDPTPGLQNYQLLFTSRPIQRMLWTTLKICIITTTLSMFFAYIVAYAMLHVGERNRSWMLLFILVPFGVSVLARCFSWLMLLHQQGLINTILLGSGLVNEPVTLVRNELGVIIGMVHYMIPYATLPLFANMQGIDLKLVTAARGLGAGSFKAFYHVFLPLSQPGIIAAGLMVFILALGFFVTPAILGGGKTVMIAEHVSIQVLQLLRWGVGAMLSVVLLVSTALLIIVMTRFVNIQEMFGAK